MEIKGAYRSPCMLGILLVTVARGIFASPRPYVCPGCAGLSSDPEAHVAANDDMHSDAFRKLGSFVGLRGEGSAGSYAAIRDAMHAPHGLLVADNSNGGDFGSFVTQRNYEKDIHEAKDQALLNKIELLTNEAIAANKAKEMAGAKLQYNLHRAADAAHGIRAAEQEALRTPEHYGKDAISVMVAPSQTFLGTAHNMLLLNALQRIRDQNVRQILAMQRGVRIEDITDQMNANIENAKQRFSDDFLNSHECALKVPVTNLKGQFYLDPSATGHPAEHAPHDPEYSSALQYVAAWRRRWGTDPNKSYLGRYAAKASQETSAAPTKVTVTTRKVVTKTSPSPKADSVASRASHIVRNQLAANSAKYKISKESSSSSESSKKNE